MVGSLADFCAPAIHGPKSMALPSNVRNSRRLMSPAPASSWEQASRRESLRQINSNLEDQGAKPYNIAISAGRFHNPCERLGELAAASADAPTFRRIDA